MHTNQDGAVVIIVGRNVIAGLALPQAVFVVFERQRVRTVACADQLLAAPCHGIAPVAQRIAHAVVGDRRAAVAGQLIAPRTVAVSVVDRRRRRAKRACCVGIHLLVQDIAPRIVFVGHRLVGNLIVFPRQTVRGIIGVGDIGAPLRDRGMNPLGLFVKALASVGPIVNTGEPSPCVLITRIRGKVCTARTFPAV